MGLIRKAILVVGVIAAMPSPPPDGQDNAQVAQTSLGAGFAYVSAVGATVSDAQDFCARQPQVCSTAQYFATSLQGKAKYSVRLISQWAGEAGVGTKPAEPKGQMVAQQATPVPVPVPAPPPLRKKTHVNVADNADLKIEDLINNMRGTLPPAKDPNKG